jgi:hypothetical protein
MPGGPAAVGRAAGRGTDADATAASAIDELVAAAAAAATATTLGPTDMAGAGEETVTAAGTGAGVSTDAGACGTLSGAATVLLSKIGAAVRTAAAALLAATPLPGEGARTRCMRVRCAVAQPAGPRCRERGSCELRSCMARGHKLRMVPLKSHTCIHIHTCSVNMVHHQLTARQRQHDTPPHSRVLAGRQTQPGDWAVAPHAYRATWGTCT